MEKLTLRLDPFDYNWLNQVFEYCTERNAEGEMVMAIPDNDSCLRGAILAAIASEWLSDPDRKIMPKPSGSRRFPLVGLDKEMEGDKITPQQD